MITHSQALETVLKTSTKTQTELIETSNCFGRVLAQDIISDIFMPPFNKSMVDGYAILRADIRNELIVDGIVSAGSALEFKTISGHCIKVMTGAPVPEGTEMVVMVEDVEQIDENKIIITNYNSADNISPKGEDIRIGDKLLSSGCLLNAAHCGIIASLGLSQVKVYMPVKVGIIVTGDEIVEPGNVLKSGQIYNSNAYQLINNCKKNGVDTNYYGIAIDTYEDIKNAIEVAIQQNDVIIITGGVSMGDYDFVGPVLKNSGMHVKFDSIAAQPGRPLIFASDENKVCFGMPGNPVSGLVLFETIVKPLLFKMMGHDFKPLNLPLKLKKTITRKKSQRKSYYPVCLNDDNTVSAINYHGSAHLNAYAEAFGIIAMEQGIKEIIEGEIVYVRPI